MLHGLVKRFESALINWTAKTFMLLTQALIEKNAKEHLINFQVLLFLLLYNFVVIKKIFCAKTEIFKTVSKSRGLMVEQRAFELYNKWRLF